MQSKCGWKKYSKKQNTLDLSLLVHVALVLVESLFPSPQLLHKFGEIMHISGDATISVHGGSCGQAVVLRVSPIVSFVLFCGGGHNGKSFIIFHCAALCMKIPKQ